MRYRYLLFCLIALAAPARAQAPAVVPVYFALPDEDWRTKPLGDAIRNTLSRTPGFNLMSAVTPGTLVISVPDGMTQNGHEANASYDFTIRFTHDGAKIGESVESCKINAVQDCATQIAADAQSAAGMMR